MNITALIVTFNRLSKLKNTIMATGQLPFQHIIIVNNGSTDGTLEWLDLIDDERVITLHKKENNGGAGGFHYGAEFISKNIETDWIVFYDDDAYPSLTFLNDFSKLRKEDNKIYCSKVKNVEGQVCKMNLPWKKKASSIFDNLKYALHPTKYIANPLNVEEVISFSFVGVIIPKKILAKTYNLIREELFIYYDDVYYSNSLFLNGYKIIFRPDLEFIHDVNVIPGWDLQEWKIYYLSRNLFLYKSLYGGEGYYSFTAKFFRIIKYFIIGMSCKNRLTYYSFLIKGIIHGMKKISGRNH